MNLVKVGEVATDNSYFNFVYVLKNLDTGLCKVGSTSNPTKRIASICSTGGIKNPVFFVSSPILRHRELESIVHKEFKADKEISEWFSTSYDTLVIFIKNYIKLNSVYLNTPDKPKEIDPNINDNFIALLRGSSDSLSNIPKVNYIQDEWKCFDYTAKDTQDNYFLKVKDLKEKLKDIKDDVEVHIHQAYCNGIETIKAESVFVDKDSNGNTIVTISFV